MAIQAVILLPPKTKQTFPALSGMDFMTVGAGIISYREIGQALSQIDAASADPCRTVSMTTSIPAHKIVARQANRRTNIGNAEEIA